MAKCINVFCLPNSRETNFIADFMLYNVVFVSPGFSPDKENLYLSMGDNGGLVLANSTVRNYKQFAGHY